MFGFCKACGFKYLTGFFSWNIVLGFCKGCGAEEGKGRKCEDDSFHFCPSFFESYECFKVLE
jgi:hypothetical protein